MLAVVLVVLVVVLCDVRAFVFFLLEVGGVMWASMEGSWLWHVCILYL